MKEAIIDMPLTGACKIDIELAIKLFNKDTFISKWKDAYRLVEENGIKVTISKEDAIRLIVELDLEGEKSPVFTSGTTYRMT